MNSAVSPFAIERFAGVGNFASYARCVEAKRLSNDKKKGEGNSKCGNKYLAWAFVEAAHFAVRYNARIKRFYQRKAAKTNNIVATKAVAHKLARAAYHVMRERAPARRMRVTEVIHAPWAGTCSTSPSSSRSSIGVN